MLEPPDDDGDSGGLRMNTGGGRLAWLITGLILVVGSTAKLASRRRDA
jgi:hypothetical protein